VPKRTKSRCMASKVLASINVTRKNENQSVLYVSVVVKKEPISSIGPFERLIIVVILNLFFENAEMLSAQTRERSTQGDVRLTLVTSATKKQEKCCTARREADRDYHMLFFRVGSGRAPYHALWHALLFFLSTKE